MTLLAFLYALFAQMPSGLTGNAWGVKALALTLSNLHAMQGVFGWITLIAVILILIILAISAIVRGGYLETGFASTCLIYVGLTTFVLWLVGFLHILAVGFLVANFSIEGAANPGFWIVLAILFFTSWS